MPPCHEFVFQEISMFSEIINKLFGLVDKRDIFLYQLIKIDYNCEGQWSFMNKICPTSMFSYYLPGFKKEMKT